MWRTIRWRCRRRRRRDWSEWCTCHWLSTQTGRSTGWTGSVREGRRIHGKDRHSPDCTSTSQWYLPSTTPWHSMRQWSISMWTGYLLNQKSKEPMTQQASHSGHGVMSLMCRGHSSPSSSIWPHLSYGLVSSKREYYHNCSLIVFLCSFL